MSKFRETATFKKAYKRKKWVSASNSSLRASLEKLPLSKKAYKRKKWVSASNSSLRASLEKLPPSKKPIKEKSEFLPLILLYGQV